MSDIKCPECGSGNAARGTTWQWLLGWNPYVSDGVEHSHDPNRRDTEYRCENGHGFHRYWWVPCPACGESQARGREGVA